MIFDKFDLDYERYCGALRELSREKIIRFTVVTFGCQQNEADSEKISGILSSVGFEKTDDMMCADVVIFNTCAVRDHAEKKALSIIGRLKGRKAENPELVIGVVGCMSAEEKTVEKIKHSYPFVSFTLEPNLLHLIPEVLYSYMTTKKRTFTLGRDSGDIVEGLPAVRRSHHRGWVSVMYGCNNFCSYCIVPYTRGRERSRRSSDIIKECRELVLDGVREITLLGQNVNSYKSDTDFSGLLSKIAEIDGDFIIRFMTSHPKDVPDSLIEVIGKYSPKIAPFFHLPIQSGSDSILKAMNRRYTRESYLEVIDKLRANVPYIALSTDIIVGFPGESDEDFEMTLDVIKRVRYDNVYCFVYSKREGTPAAKMESGVSEQKIKERMAEILEVCKEIALENNKKYEGKTVRALVDERIGPDGDVYSARTDTNKLVHISSREDISGRFVEVYIERAKPFDLVGKLV